MIYELLFGTPVGYFAITPLIFVLVGYFFIFGKGKRICLGNALGISIVVGIGSIFMFSAYWEENPIMMLGFSFLSCLYVGVSICIMNYFVGAKKK